MANPEQTITVHTIYEQLAQPLALVWAQPRKGAHTRLEGFDGTSHTPTVGPLNCVRPPRVQIIGAPEAAYLAAASADQRKRIYRHITGGETVLVVLADGVTATPDMRAALNTAAMACFETEEPGPRVSYHLRHYLGRALAQRTTIHGVFMEVLSLGVLLTGGPAIGKSELALELITRGHRLVADDAPEFALLGADDLNGSCPPLLQDFLEVRGLGILNIREMFGPAAIRRRKQLGLIIHLIRPDAVPLPPADRLSGNRELKSILDTTLAKITLPIAPGHTLAVLVEAACRDQLLRLQGYASDVDFAHRQRAEIANTATGIKQ